MDQLRLRPRLDGADGVLAVRARLRELDGEEVNAVEVELSGPSGTHSAPLALTRDAAGLVAEGELTVPAVATWWPHTHGEPALHDVELSATRESGALAIDAGRVGFRTLAAGAGADHDVEADGLDLHVNGVRVFARGAVWTPVDAIGLAPPDAELRAALEQVRDAGMNMVRVPGTGAYESEAFHDLCDELGDPRLAGLHVRQPRLPDRRRGVPGAGRGRGAPRAPPARPSARASPCSAATARSSSRRRCWGSTRTSAAASCSASCCRPRRAAPSAMRSTCRRRPAAAICRFRPDRGVANYYGVGAYLRPLEDARRAGVRFAAECLAFANVPGEETIAAVLPDAHGNVAVHHPRWKAAVPRDAGAGWDFEDVRDHYLELLFGVDPAELRSVDPERYLELSRAVSGEVMAAVFGEWRRAGSPCAGGLVLWLRDLVAGAGWGVVDNRGEPKVAYHHLRRALAPVAVWTTDEGLGGAVAHVANDRPQPLRARLRVALYRDLEQRVDEAQEIVELAPHGSYERNVEELLGRFVDASWAYRFGPPAQDLIVASLESEDGSELHSQSVRFPAGRSLARDSAARLGLEAGLTALAGDGLHLSVRSRRFADGVRVHVPGFVPSDDAFGVEPGGERTVLLAPREAGASFSEGSLTALNLAGRVKLAFDEGAG